MKKILCFLLICVLGLGNCMYLAHPQGVKGSDAMKNFDSASTVGTSIAIAALATSIETLSNSGCSGVTTDNSTTDYFLNNIFYEGLNDIIPKLKKDRYYTKSSVNECKEKIVIYTSILGIAILEAFKNCQLNSGLSHVALPAESIARAQCDVKEADFIQIGEYGVP